MQCFTGTIHLQGSCLKPESSTGPPGGSCSLWQSPTQGGEGPASLLAPAAKCHRGTSGSEELCKSCFDLSINEENLIV